MTVAMVSLLVLLSYFATQTKEGFFHLLLFGYQISLLCVERWLLLTGCDYK